MKIGIVFGTFDLLHAGHAMYLLKCGEQCDKLIVGLHTDPTVERSFKNKPVQSAFERWQQLSAVKKVEWIIPYDTEKDLLNILSSHTSIGTYFLGADYIGKSLPQEVIDICKKRNIEIAYIDRDHDFSSTELRSRIQNEKSKNPSHQDHSHGFS